MDAGRLLDCDTPAGLIARHIEPQVVEVHGEEAGRWADPASSLAERHEQVGDTHFYYCCDPHPLLDAIATTCGVRFLHRPASLEDVFLKLTGRELRDG